MANEPYSEVTSQSWGGRLMESIKGVVAGAALFIAAFPVLWMNEGCSVDTAKGLEEGAKVAVTIDLSQYSNENNGKLIHGSGKATTTDSVADSQFGINLKAIKLERKVEMFQNEENVKEETKEKLGGGKETTKTYTYSTTWSSNLINSNNFKDPKAPKNPSSMPYKSENWQASNVKVGDYKISKSMINQISTDESIDYKSAGISIPSSISSRSQISNSEIYIGKDPSNPQIGDLRISHKVANPKDVSILGQLKNGVVGAFTTSRDTTIERLDEGTLSKEDMFAAAQKENTIMTWAVRAGGFFMMYTGLSLILKPISTLGAVVPFLGNLLGMGLGLIAGLVSFVLTLITIALAWIFFRPILGIALLAVAGGVGFFLWKKKKDMAAQAPPNPNPSTAG
ncbi:MAG: hypothetical protein GW938_16165 [Leptospira sp.]|jgi:hypothetical protein|nr:hypothetical protein [Leptospira sp.]NCS92753.1 hypothetical protein [Leptospira sp.]